MTASKQKVIGYSPQSKDNGYRWIEHASRGLRVVGTAHDIFRDTGRRMNHDGWYLDPLGGGETVHGAVLQLPARHGRAQYVPAVSDPWNGDCYLADFRNVFDAPGDDTEQARRDAARAADGMAESYAETEREYRTQETARMLIEEARERIAAERKEAHALAAEMRAARALRPRMPVICAALRESMAAHRASVRAAVREIRELTENPYSWLEKAWRRAT